MCFALFQERTVMNFPSLHIRRVLSIANDIFQRRREAGKQDTIATGDPRGKRKRRAGQIVRYANKYRRPIVSTDQ